MVLACTLENSAGPSEAYPHWKPLAYFTLIIRIYREQGWLIISHLDYRESYFPALEGDKVFSKWQWLTFLQKSDTSLCMSWISDSQARKRDSSRWFNVQNHSSFYKGYWFLNWYIFLSLFQKVRLCHIQGKQPKLLFFTLIRGSSHMWFWMKPTG